MTETAHGATTTTQSPPPEPQSRAAEGTTYLVLKQVAGDSDQGWRVLEVTILAPNTSAAIKHAVGKLPEAERKGKFVAIPHRSWNPVTVSEKVERTLVIGGGS